MPYACANVRNAHNLLGCKGLAARHWEETTLSLLWGQLTGVTDSETCSWVVSMRWSEDMFSVLNKSSEDLVVANRIRDIIEKTLHSCLFLIKYLINSWNPLLIWYEIELYLKHTIENFFRILFCFDAITAFLLKTLLRHKSISLCLS